MDVGYVWNGFRWETGLRVTNVWPGYPAYGRLDPGDIITRVNGYRTRTLADFRYAMSFAGPMVTLRLRDVRTGQIMDIPPIALYPAGGPVAAAPAPGAPASPAPPAPGMAAPAPTAPRRAGRGAPCLARHRRRGSLEHGRSRAEDRFPVARTGPRRIR